MCERERVCVCVSVCVCVFVKGKVVYIVYGPNESPMFLFLTPTACLVIVPQ